ncbi:methyltransferase domain-containing protein [Ruegeria sp.]|uniref:methyltransferase domain-containing protein n=1 Tax=Ruegeria sp. TaxID=1879320 RepID=UPI003C7B80CB
MKNFLAPIFPQAGASEKRTSKAESEVPKKDRLEFSTSNQYWEERYLRGRNSGAGSYGRLADFKAEVLNDFVARNFIHSVIEFGSGDGSQLSLAKYPEYLGVDVSQTAVDACRGKFSRDTTKTFVNSADFSDRKADLTLSLDVIYHLVEDDVFANYMETLFDASSRFVIIYSSNKDEIHTQKHVRHRCFTDWVAAHRPEFRNIEHIPNRYPFDQEDPNNTSFADFYIFERIS